MLSPLRRESGVKTPSKTVYWGTSERGGQKPKGRTLAERECPPWRVVGGEGPDRNRRGRLRNNTGQRKKPASETTQPEMIQKKKKRVSLLWGGNWTL